MHKTQLPAGADEGERGLVLAACEYAIFPCCLNVTEDFRKEFQRTYALIVAPFLGAQRSGNTSIVLVQWHIWKLAPEYDLHWTLILFTVKIIREG